MNMTGQTAYNIITAAVFLVVALFHLLRIVFGWAVEIGGLDIPVWLSWIGLVVAGTLAYCGFRLSRSAGRPDG
jgi:hypothetical protein